MDRDYADRLVDTQAASVGEVRIWNARGFEPSEGLRRSVCPGRNGAVIGEAPMRNPCMAGLSFRRAASSEGRR